MKLVAPPLYVLTTHTLDKVKVSRLCSYAIVQSYRVTSYSEPHALLFSMVRVGRPKRGDFPTRKQPTVVTGCVQQLSTLNFTVYCSSLR